jgi:hypothetical protein
MKQTTKPRIELRGVKESRSLSEETPAYSATIWIDGARFCEVSNHGQGGPDAYSVGYELVKQVNARIAETYPHMTYRDKDKDLDLGPSNLEHVCHCMLDEIATEKQVKRDLAAKVLWQRDGKVYSIPLKSKKHKFTREQIVAHVRSKEPGARFLHDMPIAEARQIMERS